jgi:uncharacterized protein (TIGR02246 family)
MESRAICIVVQRPLIKGVLLALATRMSLATWRNPAAGRQTTNILNPREETMKKHVLLALVGLATGFVVPAFAQEKDTVDPQIRQQLEALSKKFDDASNKADAAALAALFTQDAVEVGPDGPVYGREALEKRYSDMFQKWHPTDHLNTIERVYMLGKDTCMIIKWSWGGQKGYVTTINVHDGDNWLVRIATVNITPPPKPAETK